MRTQFRVPRPNTGRLRRPSPTIRLRLTLLYATLFLATGAALLGVTYFLVQGATAPAVLVSSGDIGQIGVSGPLNAANSPGTPIANSSPNPAQVQIANQLYAQAEAQQARDLHALLTHSLLALGIMAAFSVIAGWWMAGRVLSPLASMNVATKVITEHNLHRRLLLRGPRDELRTLAETINHLLARLEIAFAAQRHFVANASHELRTPLTLDRALLEVTLSDQHVSRAELRAACEELLASNASQERLLEGLLTLATGERGLDRREPIDLAVLVRRALAVSGPAAEEHRIRISASLEPAPLIGDPELVARLAANLIDNAIRYNYPEGWVNVTTEHGQDSSALRVANSGPLVPRDAIDRLFQPFQRLSTDRHAASGGHGLGLSIVRAIAVAHDASIKVKVDPAGGLEVAVLFGVNAGSALREYAGSQARRKSIIRRRGEGEVELAPARTSESARS